jgi:hypothetical protein
MWHYVPMFLCVKKINTTILRLELEIHKQSPEILTVVLDSMVLLFNMRLLEKTLDLFSKLSASFTGDDLHLPDLFFDRIIKSLLQRAIDGSAVIIDGVKVDLNPCHIYMFLLYCPPTS